MAKKREALTSAKVDLGDLDLETAYLTVHGLVKGSDFTMQEVADCIKKTRQTLHVALSSSKYPFMLIEVLECLGYDASLVIKTEKRSPKGE